VHTGTISARRPEHVSTSPSLGSARSGALDAAHRYHRPAGTSTQSASPSWRPGGTGSSAGRHAPECRVL